MNRRGFFGCVDGGLASLLGVGALQSKRFPTNGMLSCNGCTLCEIDNVVTTTIDYDGYAVRTVEGHARFRKSGDMNNQDFETAIEVPDGFFRKEANYQVGRRGLDLKWHMVDKQMFKQV